MVASNDILPEIPKGEDEQKDILKELLPEYVDQFCETLKADWPLSIHAYYFIKTISEWKVKKPSLKCQLLYVNLDDNLGTFVGILESESNNTLIVVHTMEEDNQQLEQALIHTSKIPWEKNPIFEAILLKHASSVERAIRKKGRTPELYCDSTLYYMSNDRAVDLRINIPEHVIIGELSSNDIDYMYSVWAHNDIYSKQELLDAVNFNRGLGVYSKCDGKLLSWIVHTHYGGLGNLQTRKGEEGKGYAKLIIQYLSKELGEVGFHIHCTIKHDNDVSRGLFTSAGFEFKSPLKYYVSK